MITNAVLWPLLLLLLLLLLLVILLVGLFFQQYALDAQYRAQENELQEDADEDPGNIRKAWRADRQFMHNYLARNLRQNRQIFWLSTVLIPIGFVVIVLGAVISIWNGNQNIQTATTDTAFLSVPEWIIIAGLITEFLAATILFIYKSTFAQTSNYFKELARLNVVGIAAQMIDTMDANDDTIKNEAIRDSAIALLRNFSHFNDETPKDMGK